MACHVRHRCINGTKFANAGLNEKKRQKNAPDERDEISQRGHESSFQLSIANLCKRNANR
jgi:hypothetical protein